MLARRAITAAACAAYVTGFAAVVLGRPGGGTLLALVDNLGVLAAACFGVMGTAVAARRARLAGDDGAHRAWRWISAGCGAWVAGGATWASYELIGDPAVPFPGLPDVGFLACPVLAMIGLLRWPGGRDARALRPAALLDGMSAAASLLVLSLLTTLGAVWRVGEKDVAELLVGAAYPLSDVLLATFTLLLLARLGRSARTPMLLLAAGMLALAVADSGFVYVSTAGSYAPGQVFNVGWVAGFLLVGLAGLVTRPAATAAGGDALPGALRMSLPYLPLVVATVVLAVPTAQGQPLPPVEASLMTGLVALVLVRQFLVVRDNRRLVLRLRTREAELARRASHDTLTGLSNRELFRQRVERALTAGGAASSAVLFCDLDGFKSVNDSRGHQAGDELLVLVAQRLRSCLRGDDVIARFGGDEFAVLLPGAEADAALAIADVLVRAVAEPIDLRGETVHVGVSIGVATAPAATTHVDDLLRDADIAMYEAKAAGRGRRELFRPEMRDAHVERARLTQDLHGAVGRGELRVEYQPVVDLRTGRLDGMEALVRWEHPRRGLVPPSTFVPVAEAGGLISEIGAYVLREAMTDGERFAAIAGRQLSVAVNVSALQLEDGQLVEAIGAGRTEGFQLILEVTETTLLQPRLMPTLQELRRRGVRIAMDDFGVGQSSISTLRLLPLDIIKLDRSFTADVCTDTRAKAIVRAIAAMARELDAPLVAEGIEDAEQYATLLEIGCSLGQGFHIARPMPSADLRALLSAEALVRT
jgi:diguanylate cyclase (GGDEF)-like protein